MHRRDAEIAEKTIKRKRIASETDWMGRKRHKNRKKEE